MAENLTNDRVVVRRELTLRRARSILSISQSHEQRWRELCEMYLPITTEGYVWRLSRAHRHTDPEQGWKIHISATVLSANSVMEKVAPVLCELGVLFKAPNSLLELSKINSGLFYGFSQVGKFITVYPRDAAEAVAIARRLHRLTYKLPAPAVPYDERIQSNTCVYYRYGSFTSLDMEQADGTRAPAIKDPDGNLVPDLRGYGSAVPRWMENPFPKPSPKHKKPIAKASLLRTKIKAFEALSQRGKGGVYRALDLRVLPARLCVVKEGRQYGETDWDGRDGYWRVQHEAYVLEELSRAGINPPSIYETFEAGQHYYVVMEFIEGNNLQELLLKRRTKLPVPQAINHGLQIANLLHKIHSAGWVWRDCKPLNLIVTKEQSMRPLDFEGACRIVSPGETGWGTPGYVPPEWDGEYASESRAPQDLYALGVTLHQLFTGETPGKTPIVPLGKSRRRIPTSVRTIVNSLLDPDPKSRPSALLVLSALEETRLEYGDGSNLIRRTETAE